MKKLVSSGPGYVPHNLEGSGDVGFLFEDLTKWNGILNAPDTRRAARIFAGIQVKTISEKLWPDISPARDARVTLGWKK